LSINLTIDHRGNNYVVDWVITDSADRVVDRGQGQDFARYEAIDNAIMMAEARVCKLLVVKK